MNYTKSAVLIAAMSLSFAVYAAGGHSGPAVALPIPGKLGEVIVNPYNMAPLTAVIRNGGYVVQDAHVKVLPKMKGQTIEYDVSNGLLMTYAGIPVFGLYPDYVNKVEVSYTRIDGAEKKTITETYQIYTGPTYANVNGMARFPQPFFDAKVKKVDPEFADRLYLINNFQGKSSKGTRVSWNNPEGGALEWNFEPQVAVIDTTGEIRWFMDASSIYDINSIWNAGCFMGFRQNDDGQISFGYGQRYAKIDLMGRTIFNRILPDNYNDFSHSMDNSPNGNYFLRVASSNYKFPNSDKHVRTVRDVIAEVNPATGNVVDEWRLFDILDPYRDTVLKALDQGAVCLNIDAAKAGETMSAEDLAKIHTFGDILGTGPGRNWAHVNSVDHDAEDDSIIISSRHQSAAIKIGRDKEVKWILSSPVGWKSPWREKMLTPVDHLGNPLKCEGSTCEGDFDYPWTQHTAFKIDSKSKGDILYLSIFDNGDARGMEQPALPTMKYSRAVIYKIDQKKMTVEQVWSYGKDRGFEWYSPITSIVEYQKDKDSVFVYSANSGAKVNDRRAMVSAPNPTLMEFKWNASKPSLEIQLENCAGYQAMPISVNAAFAPAK